MSLSGTITLDGSGRTFGFVLTPQGAEATPYVPPTPDPDPMPVYGTVDVQLGNDGGSDFGTITVPNVPGENGDDLAVYRLAGADLFPPMNSVIVECEVRVTRAGGVFEVAVDMTFDNALVRDFAIAGQAETTTWRRGLCSGITRTKTATRGCSKGTRGRVLKSTDERCRHEKQGQDHWAVERRGVVRAGVGWLR